MMFKKLFSQHNPHETAVISATSLEDATATFHQLGLTSTFFDFSITGLGELS